MSNGINPVAMTTPPEAPISTTVTGADKIAYQFSEVVYPRCRRFLLDGPRQLIKLTLRNGYDQDYDISQATTITATINPDGTYTITVA